MELIEFADWTWRGRKESRITKFWPECQVGWSCQNCTEVLWEEWARERDWKFALGCVRFEACGSGFWELVEIRT